jgi:hypothetical protein
MSGRVILEVVGGNLRGKRFVFDNHDLFVFGRASDCHIQIPGDDATASRHHFILEANPPDAVVRDLGSLNGTWVNGVKHGGREKGATPEQGAQRKVPEVALRHGDKIKVGETVLAVTLELPAICCQCNRVISDDQRQYCAWIGGAFICVPCKEKLIASANPPQKPEPVRCRKCGKDVAAEIGKGRRGDYLCEACRKKAEADPAALLHDLLQKGGKQAAAQVPKVAGYEIGKRLGAGGFGAVYFARHKGNGAQVAIKVLFSKVAVSEDAREKFLREINLMKELRHHHIVALLDHGSAASAFYFVMELCEGGSVGDLMARNGGKLPLSQASPILMQALDGLAHAHRNGFVHRDLKPQNILLDRSAEGWTAKIADFGLAKSFQQAGFSGMTMTGHYCGTPYFMPREQVIQFKHVKPTSDIWSMGATLYNMLTSQTPHDFPRGRDPIEIILRGGIIPIRRRDRSIPKKVAEVIDRALLNSPSDRYQDAAEMREALAKAF